MAEKAAKATKATKATGKVERGASGTKRPKFYRTVAKEHPALIEAVDAVGRAVRDAGPLREKTIQLVQLAAAAAVRSEGAVHSHVRRALAAGVSASEIRHAVIVLTSTIGFPGVMAALTWVEDELEAAARKA